MTWSRLVDAFQDVGDAAPHALRRDAVRRVVGLLLLAPPVGLVDRRLEAVGHAVGIEDRAAVDVARRAPDRLDQRGARAQIALLVGVEHRDQRAFRDVEPLAQQVDADQHVEHAEPQVADDLDALQRVDVGVHVAHPHARLVQVFGQRLGHLLGQGGDQHAVALGGGSRHSAIRSSTWFSIGPDDARRIDQPGRAHDLLDEDAAGALHLPAARGGRDEDRLAAHRVPFLEFERPVVGAGGQAEAEFGEASICGPSRRRTCRRVAAP